MKVSSTVVVAVQCMAAMFCGFASAFILPSANQRQEQDSMFADVISGIASRHRRSSGSVVSEFTMNGDHDTSALNREDMESAAESLSSMSAFGIENGEHPKCPGTVSVNPADPIYKRSTCPWYYEARHNVTEFPTTQLVAIPLCINHCVGGDANTECVGITTRQTYLKKADAPNPDGSYTWTEKERRVTVGFTCVGKRMASNAPTTQSPDDPTTSIIDYE